MTILSAALLTVVAAAWLLTLVGLLAPAWPAADVANHFRLYLLAGCLALAPTAALLGLTDIAGYALGAAAFNGVVAALALRFVQTARSGAATGRRFTLVSLNVWVDNRNQREVVDFLLRTEADIVILQEMNEANVATIVPAVASSYPHVLSRVDAPHGGLVALSRIAWQDATFERAEGGRPRLIDIQYGPDLGGLRVLGTHLAFPFRAALQASHANWLGTHVAGLGGPAIVVGDFNLTPWSWQLFRFSIRCGLQRVGTWIHSWPAPRIVMGFPFSLFLIDHVFVTDGVAVQHWTTGPAVGSDHRPVIVHFTIPVSEQQHSAPLSAPGPDPDLRYSR